MFSCVTMREKVLVCLGHPSAPVQPVKPTQCLIGHCFAFATNARLSNFGNTIRFDLLSIRSVACSIWFRYAFGPHMKESMKDDLYSWSAKPNHERQTEIFSHVFFYIKVCRTRLYISSLLICESFLCATRTRIKISTYHHGIYHGVYPCYSKHP